MKPDDFEGLVGFRARALVTAREQNGGPPWGWYEMERHAAAKDIVLDEARATIIAEYEAGIVPCPVEATETLGYTSPYTPKEAAIESRAKPTADTR